MNGTATLAQKRAAYESPAFQKSLALLRQASALNIRLPENDTYWSAKARNFMRLLLIEQYVLLADGRTRAAVDSLADGLRFGALGRSPGSGGTVGRALTAYALDSTLLNTFAGRLNQLPARDCDRLLAILLREANTPDATPTLLEADRLQMRQWALRQASVALTPSAGKEAGEERSDDFEVAPADRDALRRWKGDPAAEAALHAAVTRQMDTAYDRAAAMLRDPARARFTSAAAAAPPAAHTSPGQAQVEQIAAAIVTMTSPELLYWNVEGAIRHRAQTRLFAVMVALRRYGWEHGEYAERLDALGLRGAVTTDPFTGQPFRYERTSRDAYTLSSAGPPKRDENGQVRPGEERAPITLPGSTFAPPPPLP